MKMRRIFRTIGAVTAVFGAVLVTGAVPPAGAQQDMSVPKRFIPVQAAGPRGAPEPGVRNGAQPPGTQFPQELLKPNARDPEATRKEVLEDLFERLSKAGDEESAEVIADAIEKIWARSGSDTVDLLMQRAAEMIQEENIDIALNILDSVVAIAPDYAEGWNQRAAVFFLKRDFRRSLEDLRHVLALEPRHFKAISGLGLIMQELGDKKAALKAFRKALEVHPQFDDARQYVRELSREVEGQGI